MDYYKILNIDKNATDVEIKKAYRKLAVKWHPDKNKNNKEAEQKFKDVSEAYGVLSDSEKRGIFDEFGKAGVDDHIRMNEMNGGHGFPGSQFSFNTTSSDNIDDIFEQCFGAGTPFDPNNKFGFMGEFYENDDKKKGPVVERNLSCTLENLYNGCVKKLKVNRKVNNKEVSKVIEITVDPGWKEGTKLTYPELGDETRTQEPGDIIFVVKERLHKFLKRDNNDLLMTCDITLDEALNGFTKDIVGINKQKHKIKVNKLANSNETHRVMDGGMPIRKNKRKIGYGDLVVSFNIIFC